MIDSELAQRVTEIVTQTPAEYYSVARLAELIGMKRSSFAKAFKLATGTTPMDFVMALRLERARQLLGTTALSVADVAARSGFVDRSHFSRAFRARFGESPAKLRRHNGA